MKKLYLIGWLLLSVSYLQRASGQICDSITPVFNVNLTGQPSGIWTSPAITRDGHCCGVTNPDKCIEFIVTLDSNSNGISFDIASGAVPPGALFYQVNCGPPVQVGQPICLSGPGPHLLTFCKPGNNTNSYQITSIPKPSMSGTQWVSMACTGQLSVVGLIDTSIHWTSMPPNPVYNSYLSCTSGCDSVTVTPNQAILPAFVDYQVCGFVIGGCVPFYFCDTIRVHFVNDLAVTISPQNPTICFGGSNAVITANTGGGLAPFHYSWSTGDTTQSISVGAGTYIVQLTDAMNCSTASDTVIVNALPSPIQADAGPDQLFCATQQSVSLHGNVIAAMGGQWLSGSGTFSPNDTTLNASYTPSASEYSIGLVQLMLITTGNSSCPADTDITIITVSPNPLPSISGNTRACLFSVSDYVAPFFPGINYNWSVTGGTFINTATNSINVHWTQAGTGTITLTETNAATCDSTITFNVSVYPQPAPIITGPSSTCTSTISQFSISNPDTSNTYSWSVTGGTIAGSSNGLIVNILWTNAGNSTVTVTAANSLGCDSSITTMVNVSVMPAPVINGISSLCSGQTINYSTPFVRGNTYTWSVSGGTIVSTNSNSIQVLWPASGSGTVSVTESNTLLCDSTVQLAVAIHPQPAPMITGPSTTCTTTSSQFSISNPDTANTYSWIVSGGSIVGSATGTSINVLWTNAGNSTIRVTASNSYGCDSSIIIPVHVDAIPTPVVNGAIAVCEGRSIIYSTPFVFGNTYTWNVTGGNVLSINNNSIAVLWSNVGSGTVSLTESTFSGCDSTVQLAIVIGPQPVPVIQGPIKACVSVTSQYTISNPDPANSYSWMVNGGTIVGSPNDTTITILWSLAGNAIVTVTEANSFGCDSTVSFPVAVSPIPAPALNGPPNTCELSTETYSVPFVQGDNYYWSVLNGGIVSFSITNSIDVYWNSAGTGEIHVRQETPDGCDSSVMMSVSIHAKPQPLISGPRMICEHESAIYIANFDSSSNFDWTLNGGSQAGNSQGDSLNVQWNQPGPGSISLVQTTPQGCTNEILLPVVVNAKPHPTIQGNNFGCISQFQNNYNTVAEPGVNYQWNVTGGTINANNGNNIAVQWTNPGTNFIMLTGTDANTGCDSTVTFPVNTDSLARPAVSASGFNGCAPLHLSFSSNVLNPNYNYQWNFGDGNSSSAYNPAHYFDNPGVYPIQLIVTNNTGCADTVSSQVVAYNSPDANFLLSTNSDIYYADISHLFLSNHSSGASQYFWDFGNGDTSTAFEPGYDYIHPGNYQITLTVVNQYGCMDRTTVPIEVKVPEDIFVPSAFTPNGDNSNDYFDVKSQNITDLNIRIFNRWGEEIFHSTDVDFKWDGTYRGHVVQQDVYVYLIQAKGYHGKLFNLAGSVTVLN